MSERAFVPRASDPRDQAFLDYWGRVIDWSDPAADKWLAHFEQRVTECRKVADAIARHRPLEGARALDVGCQTGALACVMAERGAVVTGVEPEDWVLEAGRLRAKGWGVAATFQTATGESLPFASGSFDVVTFVDVIEHCRDADACLREIARVLAPGGVAYVYGPNRFSPHWLKSDPHYGLALASVLPNELGRRYVEWRRGKKGYDVGVFPVGNHVANVLSRAGLELVDSPVHRAKRRATGTLGANASRIEPLVRAWGQARLLTDALFTLVAVKPGSERA
ncbi:MAG: methyltransferase domain-containing protein [Myxococcales bacterium]|nr:methyltransferase domain-containing protein [Myxococcales bacterium]